jgi:hypothetical protein
MQEYSLDKEIRSYDDLIDALRLSLRGYKISQAMQDVQNELNQLNNGTYLSSLKLFIVLVTPDG